MCVILFNLCFRFTFYLKNRMVEVVVRKPTRFTIGWDFVGVPFRFHNDQSFIAYKFNT